MRASLMMGISGFGHVRFPARCPPVIWAATGLFVFPPKLSHSSPFRHVFRSSWTSRAKLPLVRKMFQSLPSPPSPTSTLGTRIRYRGNSDSGMCKCASFSFLSLVAHPDTRKGLP